MSVAARLLPSSPARSAVGFYNSPIRIGHGSAGGWDEFRPRRQIIRSRNNVLLELDGEPTPAEDVG
jgi:hypothetical protein